MTDMRCMTEEEITRVLADMGQPAFRGKQVNRIMPKKAEAKPARLCPYCRMEIADDATKCPHCTSSL